MAKLYCLHGFLGLPSDWDFLNQSVMAPNLFQKPILPFDDWATHFNSQVDPKKDNILIGYSLGGRLALHALVDRPDLWKAAVIISANPGITSGQQERLASDEAWAERFAHDPWEKVLSDWNGQSILSSSTVAPRREEEFDRSALAESLGTWSLGKQKNLQPAIEALALPILWVVGEQDHKFRVITEKLQLNESSRVEIVPQAGHRILFDEPKYLEDLITSLESLALS